MFFDLKEKFLNFISDRFFLLYIFAVIITAVLMRRIFILQIVEGENYQNNFSLSIEKELKTQAARGNIYDRNGVLLAYNDLAYSVTLNDTVESGNGKNEKLNTIIYNMNRIIKENGDDIECEFSIYIDEEGNFVYSVEDSALLRFLADVYDHKYTSDLLYSEKTSNPDDVINYLAGEDKFGVGGYLQNTEGEDIFVLGMGYSKEELLDIVRVRYNLAQNTYQKYISITVSSQITDKTVAAIMENSDILPGVNIEETTVRRYNDPVYFSPIIGYVGRISPTEYDYYSSVSDNYTTNDVVGKTGIEYSMETSLQGIKGLQTVNVDSLGRITEVLNEQIPVAGNDVYLTIDSDLQKAMYTLVEQKIAGILLNKIRNVKTVDDEGRNPLIPIYDVYFALFNNNVIDFNHMSKDYASDTEKEVYASFLAKQDVVLEKIRDELTTTGTAYNNLSQEYQVYESYIVTMLSSANYGLILNDKIDTSDQTYIDWKINETISLKEYLNYCIAMEWIDIGKLAIENEYADSSEIYSAVVDYIIAKLEINPGFHKKMIKYLIQNDTIYPRQILVILWEQDVITSSESDINNLKNGVISSYDFMTELIRTLQITPAQLGLEPCSGSVVITDTNTGEVLALVSYPGYDNNKLANSADSSYLAELNADLSKPLWNYATQQRTAPGSTFKMLAGTAGVMEGVISTTSTIQCTGSFTKLTDTVHKCWIYPGAHGSLGLSGAITNSCNCFFYEVGYRLALDGNVYSNQYGIDRLAKYADMFGLSEKSGVEITESDPSVSTEYPVASAIGQGTNSYTTVALARYCTAIANSGTVFNLSLIYEIRNAYGDQIYTYAPDIRNTIELPDDLWYALHSGMRGVVLKKAYFNDLDLATAGKTGTAQEATNKPNHALFIGYAPYDNPTMALAIRIANGYTSDYPAQMAVDVYKYYFGLTDEEDLLNGEATDTSGGVIGTD